MMKILMKSESEVLRWR